MSLKSNEAVSGGNRSGFGNQFNRGRNQKVLDVSDYAENQEKLQSNLIAIMKPSKVIRLFRCFGCDNHLAVSKFSVYRVVCKKCVAAAKEKSKLGQSNFIERALNNFRKNLKGALTNV